MNERPITIREKVSRQLMVLKFFPGIPCILWGFFIGVIGIGPEGWVPWNWRLIGLCILITGVAIAYPFSIIRWRGAWNWIIVILTSLPLWLVFIGAMVNPKAWLPDFSMENVGIFIVIGLFLLLPVLSAIELLLSGKGRRFANPSDP